MKPETRTVTELFERDVRYVVPLYQRPYVWNEADQWEPLWEDIRVLVDHQLNGAAGPEGHWSHFLGAIVLDQETQAPGSIPVYTVIDGQQRLTTLQILLAAAANVAAANGAGNDAEVLLSLIRNRPLKASGEHLWKVWPTNANRTAFAAVVRAGGPAPDREDDPTNLIDEAYGYFVGRIADWLSDAESEEDKPQLVRTLQVTLCDLLRMVSITLEQGDNAQVIFETLNARGTPLLALDLVKNAVFHEAARHGLDVDALYETVWKPQLDDEHWRKNQRQGRLFRPRADLFLMHWLTMKLRRITPATELFTTFRKQILQAAPPPNMEDVIRELCRDAAVMRDFEAKPAGSVEALFFRRLEALDVTTVLPLVLLLFREPAISSQRRTRALQILESWLVRRSLLRLTVKAYNAQVPVLISRVADDPARADEILVGELRAGTGEISRWPADAELRDYYDTHDVYNSVGKARLVMALSAVEQSLYSNKTDLLTIPTNLTLEHVIPQKWQTHWPLPDGLSPEEEEAARETRLRAIHRLGNLTLTAGPLNTALSNSAWPDKQRALNAESRLLLNARLVETYPETFDEAAVAERTRVLIERVCAIWPGPEHDWAAEAPGEGEPTVTLA
jgi:Protein of unknown function DUF262/Protein of unknown function (DUF1524)